MTAGILSSHRKFPPFGLNNGKSGQVGINTLIKNNGKIEILPSCVQIDLQAGDSIQIETPGGGGFG